MRLTQESIHIGLAQGGAVVAGLVTSVITARVLGPEAKGVVDLFNLIVGLLADLALVGVPSGLLYALTRRSIPPEVAHGTGITMATVAAAVTVVAAASMLVIGMHWPPNVPPWVLAVVAVVMPAAYYKSVWSGLMTGTNRAPVPFILALIGAALGTAALATLAAAGSLTLASAILTIATLQIATAVAAFVIFRRLVVPSVRVDRAILGGAARFGVPLYISTLASLLHFRVDQLMINSWLGVENVGVYAVSVRFAEGLFIVDGIVVTAALYRVASSSEDVSHALTMRVVRAQTAIALAMGAIIAAMSAVLIEPIYGTAFRGAVQPLLILLPGIIGWSISKVVANRVSYNLGRPWPITSLAGGGLLLNVSLNYLFLRGIGMGLNGAALASSISYGAVAVGVFVIGRRSRRAVPQ